MRRLRAMLLVGAMTFGVMSVAVPSAQAVDHCNQPHVDKAYPVSSSGYIVQSCDGNTRIQYNIDCLFPGFDYSIVRTFPRTGASMRFPVDCGAAGNTFVGITWSFV